METFSIETVKNESGILQQVVCKGEFILENQSRVKESLEVLDLTSCKKLEILLNEVTELDLAFLQVFYSFILKLREREVDYSLFLPDDEELKGLIERSGIYENFKSENE